MPAPKGSKNARAYQVALVSKNKRLVAAELARLKEVRAKFDSITSLSQAVSKATPLTDVTIRRNTAYRELILKYINDQGARSGYMSRAESELNKLRHKITELEIRLSNISADNQRLRAYVSNLKDSDGSTLRISSAPSDESEEVDEVDWEQNCYRTYQLVCALVSHGFYEINFSNNTVEDRTGIEGNEVVAGGNLAKPFVEWFRKQGLGDGNSKD
tara:strand:+ start:1055 stop:1699 length:645 start_codon:yes stop_codon:yes gene_type:complete